MGNSVKVTIISEFDSWGTAKAQAAMNETASHARKTNSAVQSLGETSAFETFGGKVRKGAKAAGFLSMAMGDSKGGVGTVAKAAGGAMMAFAMGGWAGLILAGGSAIINHFFEMKKKAEEFAAASKKAFHEGLIKSYQNQLEGTRKDYDDIIKRIEQAEQRIEKISTANEKLNRAGEAVDKANAENLKQNVQAGYSTQQRYGGLSPEEKGLLAAREKLDIVKLTNAEQIRAATMERSDAERTIKLETERAQILKSKLDAAKEQLGLAQESADRIPKTGDRAWDPARKEAAGQIEKASLDIEKTQTELDANRIDIQAAQVALEAATTKLSTVRTDAAVKENDALDAMDDLEKNLRRLIETRQKIITQEQRIEIFEKRLANMQGAAAARESYRNKAADESARQFHADHAAKIAAEKTTKKANDSEARWAKGVEQRMKSGAHIGERERQRLEDYRNWMQLKNRGGDRAMDAAEIMRQQLENAKQNLSEMKGLRGDLQKNLEVR